MGICFSKKNIALDHHPPVIFAEENLSSRKEGGGNNFEQLCDISDTSTSDSNSAGSLSKKEFISLPLSASSSEISHHSVDSNSCSSITTSEQVGVGPVTENKHPHRLIDLLHDTRLVMSTKSSPTRLCPLSKSNSKSTSTSTSSFGLIHEHREEALNPNTECIITSSSGGLKSSSSTVLVNPVAISKHSQIKEGYANAALPPMWNIDQYYSISSETDPTLTRDCKEYTNGRSNHGGGLVDLSAHKINCLGCCERRQFDSRPLANGRLCNVLMEGDKAFGSPFCVDRHNSCEGREDKTSEFWKNLSADELSDSSSDLFDIDFRKHERGVL